MAITNPSDLHPGPVIRELLLTRVLDAPRELVFEAWTRPEHLAAWWGPKRFTNPACDVDARPGGSLRIVMRAPDGTEFPMGGSFQEVLPPERLVFISTAFDQAEGGPLLKVLNTITFRDLGGRTGLTVKAQVLHAAPGMEQALAGMEEGWSQSLDRLDDLTLDQAGQGAAAREFGASRLLDAPRDLIFRLWTEPAHVEKWWGPAGFRNTVHAMDVRVGGQWRLTMHGPDGTDYPNLITYLEVLPPHRLVYHHGACDPTEPGQFITTVTFEDHGGRTLLTVRGRFKTAAERDAIVEKHGAVEGLASTLSRLEAYLATI